MGARINEVSRIRKARDHRDRRAVALASKTPPAALFFYSANRAGEHPRQHLVGYGGILQADAYGGYARLYAPDRRPSPITEAGCCSHARRNFFVLADLATQGRRKAEGQKTTPISHLALEAVRRIDLLFDVERVLNGKPAAERLAVRRDLSAPLVAELDAWMAARCA